MIGGIKGRYKDNEVDGEYVTILRLEVKIVKIVNSILLQVTIQIGYKAIVEEKYRAGEKGGHKRISWVMHINIPWAKVD